MKTIKPALILAFIVLSTGSLAQTDSVPIVVEPRHENIQKPAQPKAPVQTRPVQNAKPVPILREPVQVVVPDSRKSGDQREYETTTQKRLDVAIQDIEKLKSSFEGLPADRREGFLGLLRMTEGNRSAARTKFKQMKYISPSNWQSITRGIDQALEDLEISILRANEYLLLKDAAK